MAAMTERVAGQEAGVSGRPSWLKVGATVTGAEIVLHAGGGTLINAWEGWRLFFENLVAYVVSGVVLGLLAFGLLLRWGLKDSPKGRNRPAIAGMVGGVLSVLSYALFFVWAPVFFGAAAVVLGRTGLRRSHDGRGGDRAALAAILLGLAALAFWLFYFIYVLIFKDFPVG
jgi:hypothetical protein